MKKKNKYFQVRVSEKLQYYTFKYCIENDLSVSKFIRLLIERYFDEIGYSYEDSVSD